jgi:hypothetical protein
MPDWEVTVMTDSNYIKRIRVNDCYTRTDAEASALGMTGAQRVLASTPKTYKDDVDDDDYSSSSSSSTFTSGDGGDAIGILILGPLLLLFVFWQYILLIGGIALVIWLLIKYLNRDTY